jgi:cytochrome P450
MFVINKNGEITYESVHEMTFMEMVIDETMRMYPASSRTDRAASSDYEYKNMKIKKGDIVNILIYAIHHDETYYPEPYKFMPERFSEINKKTRPNETFIPFGAGPRSCVAMRFALLEIKLLLASILTKYKFEKCEKTIVNKYFISYFIIIIYFIYFITIKRFIYFNYFFFNFVRKKLSLTIRDFADLKIPS